MNSTITIGQSSPLGATVFADGVNFSVFSKNATGMELLLFDEVTDSKPRGDYLGPGKEPDLPLLARFGSWYQARATIWI